MLINATFFHVLPVVVTKGRFSPGLFTAVILFYPVGMPATRAPRRTGLLSIGAVTVSFVIGALLMAYPIVLIRTRSLAYFRQDR